MWEEVEALFPLPYSLSTLGRFTRVNEEDLLQQDMNKKTEAKSKPPKWAEQNQNKNQELRRDRGDVTSERFPELVEPLPGTGWNCPM